MPNTDQDLVAVTHFFATLGYEIHLRPQGPCEVSKVDEGGILHTIPIRWDGTEKGSFLDIIVSDRTDLHELAGAYVLDLLDHRSTDRVRARNAATFPIDKIAEVISLTQPEATIRAYASKRSDPLNCRLNGYTQILSS